jgi:hypothetical protein
LIVKNSLVTAMEFSRCARRCRFPFRATGSGMSQSGLSKLNSVRRGRRCSRRTW